MVSGLNFGRRAALQLESLHQQMNVKYSEERDESTGGGFSIDEG